MPPLPHPNQRRKNFLIRRIISADLFFKNPKGGRNKRFILYMIFTFLCTISVYLLIGWEHNNNTKRYCPVTVKKTPRTQEERKLLPPLGSAEEAEILAKFKTKGEPELPEISFSLPVPYSEGVTTFTSRQVAENVSSIDPEWVELVTTSSELEMYTDVAQPPAWCRETRTRLKDGERPPYVHQWDIVCERDGKTHRLSLFAEEGEREWHLDLRGTMVPCTLTHGTVHQGHSSIINFMSSMENWFHECEDGRRLLFIGYHAGNWYADLYFSIKDGKMLYHGSEYVSEEAAASM